MRLPPQQRRVLELERQLADAQAALARQQRESEENATSFSQAMARLSHSERTLGQTKAKLMDVEERLQKSEAHGATLTQQLNLNEEEITRLEHELEAAQVREFEQNQSIKALRAQSEAKARELAVAQEGSAEGVAECARLTEDLKAAEEREQRGLGRALNAEAEHTSTVTELQESKRRQAELTEQHAELKQACDAAQHSLASARTTLAELEAERSLAQQELASTDHERARIIGILAALEALGREIVEVGSQARKATETRTKLMPEDTESERVTLKPAPASKRTPKRSRSSAGPEITIDGVRLDR
ncbi:MAG TPA: hypothetical protein VER96_39710 [Polyangiaceae bacterium]|nr:hypothetical protein [Polyangiaceae bacterium]